jgi:hypothetical protein
MLQEMYYWLMYFLKKIGKTDMLEFNSYLLICMLVAFNFLTVLIIICFLLHINPKEFGIDRQTTKIAGGIFGVVVVVFNYFYLYKNKDQIGQKYDHLKGPRRIRGMIAFWVYVILSVVLLFTLGPALTA